MAASGRQKNPGGEALGSRQSLSTSPLAVCPVTAILDIIHSRDESLPSSIAALCKHLVSICESGSEIEPACPPRLLAQAKNAARKWILDLFSNSAKEFCLDDEYAVPLWSALLAAISWDCCEVCSV
jgi:hypothetical protein